MTGARDERPKGKFERSRARTVQARDRWKAFLSLGSASPDHRVVRCKSFPFPFRHMLSEYGCRQRGQLSELLALKNNITFGIIVLVLERWKITDIKLFPFKCLTDTTIKRSTNKSCFKISPFQPIEND